MTFFFSSFIPSNLYLFIIIDTWNYSLFLKSRYGVGYHLHLAKGASFNASSTTSLVKSYVHTASMENDEASSTEMVFSLPFTETMQFSPMFADLTSKRNELGLRSFGITMTTLEEVFMHLNQSADENVSTDGRSTNTDHNANLSPTGQKGLLVQDDTTVHVTSHRINSINDCDKQLFTDDNNHSLDNVLEDAEDAPLLSQPLLKGSSTFSEQMHSASTRNGSHRSTLMALMIIRWKQRFREWRSLFFQLVLPAVLLIISLTVIAKPTSNGSKDKAQTVLDLSPNVYQGGGALRVPVLDQGGEFYELLNKSEGFIHTGATTQRIRNESTMQGDSGFLTKHNFGFACAFQQTNDSGLHLFHNTTMVHAAPIYLVQFGNAFLGAIGEEVIAFSHPLPPKRELTFDQSTFYTVLLLGMALSVVPGGFALNAVKDRETKMKALLEVSGVSTMVYWLADLLTSMSLFSVSVVIAIVLTISANVEPLLGPGLVLFIVLCIIYMPLTILFSYLVSYLFSDSETCQSVFPPLNNFLGFIPFIIVGTVDGLGKSTAALAIHYTLATLLPPYSLTGAVYYMFRLHTVASFDESNPLPSTQGHLNVLLARNEMCINIYAICRPHFEDMSRLTSHFKRNLTNQLNN